MIVIITTICQHQLYTELDQNVLHAKNSDKYKNKIIYDQNIHIIILYTFQIIP